MLALDIATNTGWATDKSSGEFKSKDVQEFKKRIEFLVKEYAPNIIITCKPTNYYNTIFLHGKLFGILELVCLENDIKIYKEETKKGNPDYPIDGTIKKEIIGNGKCTKFDICQAMGELNEDIADAKMFLTYLKQKTLGE